MIDAFVEGARSIVQACHLVILAPVMLAVLAGRGRWQVVAGGVAGIALGGWLFATRWLVLDETAIRWSALVVIASLLGIGLGDRALRLRRGPAEADASWFPWLQAALAAISAVVATSWWRPCVGEELGEILTQAPGAPWAQLLPTVGFMLGISIPVVLVGLAMAAWHPSPVAAQRVTLGATGVGLVLGATVLAGRHGEIVARLFEWSEPFV